MREPRPTPGKQQPAQRRRRTSIWLLVLLALNSIVLSAVLVRDHCRHSPAPERRPRSVRGGRDDTGHSTRNGPWGRLDLTRTWIEVPEDFLPSAESLDFLKIEWFVPSRDQVDVHDFFVAGGLTTRQCEQLLVEERVRTDLHGTTVDAPPELVKALSREVRGKLYVALSHYEENRWHHEPIRHHKDRFDQWLLDSSVSPRIRRFIRKYSYRNGNTICFSDLYLLMQMAGSPEERLSLVKFMSRKSVLMAQLTIPPGKEAKPVAAYWAKGKHRQDILHMIMTSAGRPNGDLVDISLLLPPFARKRIYTYPFPEIPMRREVQNCFWTAAHFDTDTFRHDLHRAATFQTMLNADYERVFGERTLGDLLVFINDQNELIHAAVYLAADLAYTKNGWYHTMPWRLMEIEYLQAFYSIRGGVMHTYRRRPPPPSFSPQLKPAAGPAAASKAQ